MWRIEEGQAVDLSTLDAGSKEGTPDGVKAATSELRDELAELQRRLFAEARQSVLVVLQAMDAGGKDGTIRKVFSGMNPQGVRVHGWGAPNVEELAHDFLWRIHHRAPSRGRIAVFNRSHYEDVVAVRVRKLASEDVWRGRYEHIRAFERLLEDNGTRIVKLFLHISKEEQLRRFEERETLAYKQWKLAPSDYEDRELWDDFQVAYAEAMARTSTDTAPWWVVPADSKKHRNWFVADLLARTLREMAPQWPKPAG